MKRRSNFILKYSLYGILLIAAFICFSSCIKEESFNKGDNDNLPYDTASLAILQGKEAELHEIFFEVFLSDIINVLANVEIHNYNLPSGYEDKDIDVKIENVGDSSWPKIVVMNFDTIKIQSLTRFGKVTVLNYYTEDSLHIIKEIYTNSRIGKNYTVFSDSTKSSTQMSESQKTIIFKRLNTKKDIIENGNTNRLEIEDSVINMWYFSNAKSYLKIKTIKYFKKSGVFWNNDLLRDTLIFTGATQNPNYYYGTYSKKILEPLIFTYLGQSPFYLILSKGKVELSGTNGRNTQGFIGYLVYNQKTDSTEVVFTRKNVSNSFMRNPNKNFKGIDCVNSIGFSSCERTSYSW